MSIFLICTIILFFPWLALELEKRVSFFEKLGAIVTCYAFGVILGNIGWDHGAKDIINEIMSISIPLAIPLFILNTDFMKWLKDSKTTVLSFGFCLLSVCIMTLAVGLIFQSDVAEAWQISGMLAGVYTGGTPNLTAIGQSLSVAEETLILVNSLDMLAGAIILFVLLYFGKSLLKGFLPETTKTQSDELHATANRNLSEIYKGGLIGLGISITILGISFGLTHLIFGSLSVAFLIFLITSFGIGLSFSPKIRSLNGPYEFGHYLLMIFCTSIGSLADVSKLFNNSTTILLMVAIVVFGSVILHILFAKIFKIDRDTTVITAVAAIFGPPFVPLIADRFDNRGMIIPGMTTGLIGFAVGNYLGLTVAYFLKSLI